MPPSPPPPASTRGLSWLLITLIGLVAVLGFLFAGSFHPEKILFSSDGPLGGTSSQAMSMPEAFRCIWRDLNWVGGWGGNMPPNVSYLWFWLLGPLGFAKFYAPLSVLMVGLSVWLLFRQLGFKPWIGLLGAAAAALNTDFFSYACWGLGTLTICVAWIFVALAALADSRPGRHWLKACVAGFAVGMAILEGIDSGAILSLYVAAFVLFQAVQSNISRWQAWVQGLGRVGVVAGGAAVVAFAALSMLVSTQIKGVVGMDQDTRTKMQRWEDATQWSLPKIETLRVVIPGLFGYRLDTPNGGNYWGRVGERPGVLARHSGSGVYVGVAVAVLALWGVVNAGRRKNGPFTPEERRWIWFWTGAACVSLGLAWGKYAPFYQIVYGLPYFSTIRNPIKFIHPFSVSVVILSGYGFEALARLYLAKTAAAANHPASSLKAWWAQAVPFERKWWFGSALAMGAGLLGWLLYAASRQDLVNHLRTAVSPELAPAIAGFSLTEMGWFVLFLGLTLLLLLLVGSGILGGTRARWGVAALGLVLVGDLIRANAPWVYYWNYREKYASNEIIDFLRTRPYEHRVAMPPFRLGESYALLQQLYHAEWLQHQFQYYNVQSLDVIQEPRTSLDNARYRGAFGAQGEAGLLRQWQLTNTRYLFGVMGGMVDLLNQRLDSARQRFQVKTPFGLTQERDGGPILMRTNTTGPFALIEFTGALPRGKLYSHWQIRTNDDEVLQTLTNPGYDPAASVVVSEPAPGLAPSPPGATNQTPGTVEVLSYAPKLIRLKARATLPSVLLWNDKFDPHWTVTVEGRPQPLLRCNFLMRGVQVPAGEHVVEFRFDVPSRPLWISLAAIAVGLALSGLLFWQKPKLAGGQT